MRLRSDRNARGMAFAVYRAQLRARLHRIDLAGINLSRCRARIREHQRDARPVGLIPVDSNGSAPGHGRAVKSIRFTALSGMTVMLLTSGGIRDSHPSSDGALPLRRMSPGPRRSGCRRRAAATDDSHQSRRWFAALGEESRACGRTQSRSYAHHRRRMSASMPPPTTLFNGQFMGD